MALEDLTGASKFLDDLVKTNPDGATDYGASLDDHIRGLKNVLLNTFPNLDAAVTPTPAELNSLAGRQTFIDTLLQAATLAAARTVLDVPANAEAILQSLLTTSGDTIYRDGSGAARRAVGSARQVYTVVSGVPNWASPQGFYPITAKTALVGSETEVEIPSGQVDADSDFLIHILGRPNGDAIPWAQVKETTYLSGASDYAWHTWDTADTSAGARNDADTQIELLDNNLGGGASDADTWLTMEVFNLGDGSYPTHLQGNLVWQSTGSTMRMSKFWGRRNAAVAADTMKIFWDAGETFRASGYYQIYKRSSALVS